MSMIDTVQPHEAEKQPDVDAIQSVINTLPDIVKESKAGVKTTEFWLVILTAVLVQMDAIPLPDKYHGWVSGALAVAYVLSRGIAKSGNPVVESKAPEA